MNRIENKTSGEYTSEITSLNILKNLPYINVVLDGSTIKISAGSMFDIAGVVYAQDTVYEVGAYDEGKYVVVSSTGFAIEAATPIWSDLYQSYYSSGKRVLAKCVDDQVLLLNDQNYMSGLGIKMYEESLFDYYKNLFTAYQDQPVMTNQDITDQGNFRKVIWTGTYYVGVGSKATSSTGASTDYYNGIAYSSDLLNWTWCSLPNNSTAGRFIQDVADNGSGTLIAVQYQITTAWKVYKSTNHGVSWSDITSSVASAGTAACSGITYTNNKFIISGSESNCIFHSSNNGTSWTKATVGVWPYKVIYANSIYVAACSGAIYSSTDLSTWTLRQTITSGYAYDVVYENGTFIAFGGTSANRAIWTSTNGTSWDEYSASDAAVDFATWASATHSFRSGVYFQGRWWIVARQDYCCVASTPTLINNNWTRIWATPFYKSASDTNYTCNFETITECNGYLVIGGYPQSTTGKFGWSYSIIKPKVLWQNTTDF